MVPVYDAGESRGIAYMVMRYVHGPDLCAMTGRLGPLDPVRAAEIVAAWAARWTPCTAPDTCTATSSRGTC